MIWPPELTDRQSQAWHLLHKDYIKAVCYGGAKGGGKSVFGVYWLFSECYEIARKFVPKVPKHPIPVAFMGRKVAKHFKETTLDTWKRFIPESEYKIKGDPAEITIADRVLIRTGGLEAKEELEKFNSAEFARIFVDQAEETTRDDVSALQATFRLVIGKNKIPGKILFTANPAQCWLKDDYILNPREDCKFVQALPSDNPFLPDSYIQTLRDAFGHRPEMLEAYLFGSWDALEGSNQIVKDIWIRQAQERTLTGLKSRPRIVCDPARYGDDERVIYYAETTNIIEQDISGKSSTTQTARDLISMSERYNKCPIVVEEDGIGGGVIDDLRDMGRAPIVFLASSSAHNKDRYGNLRAEAWFNMGKHFAEGKVEFKHKLSRNDLTTLIHQLTTPCYKLRNSKIFIESKDDIKKRLGGSPDRADGYMLLDWSYDKVPIIEADEDYYVEDENVGSYEVHSLL